jgi:hypothetical protein
LLTTLLILVASTRHVLLTSRVSLSLARRPSAQFANSRTRFYHSSTRFTVKDFFPTSCLTREVKKITTNELHTRTKFLRFLNQAPRSLFKKLIVSMPTLLRGLHTMSLLKSVPEGLKPRECKRVKLCEPPPVPYVPTKDEVQDEVAKLRNLKIKTTIEKDTRSTFRCGKKTGPVKPF